MIVHQLYKVTREDHSLRTQYPVEYILGKNDSFLKMKISSNIKPKFELKDQ